MIIGSKRIYCKNLPSTNTYCAALLKKGPLREGTIIYTNFQTAGRGQSENNWESEADKNLLFSIILYPSFIKPENQFIISKTISLGICDFLEKYLLNVSVKWPNDIYVNNDKIAGILIENSLFREKIVYVIAGIGLNVNQEFFLSNAPNPTSMKILTGFSFELKEMLKVLSTDLDKRYKELINKKFSQIDNDYISHLYRYNLWSEFKDSLGVFEGKIDTLSKEGKLQIEDHRGRIREYDFKEVDFL